jgi:hypothetical protein
MKSLTKVTSFLAVALFSNIAMAASPGCFVSAESKPAYYDKVLKMVPKVDPSPNPVEIYREGNLVYMAQVMTTGVSLAIYKLNRHGQLPEFPISASFGDGVSFTVLMLPAAHRLIGCSWANSKALEQGATTQPQQDPQPK